MGNEWTPQDELAFQSWMRLPGSGAHEWYGGMQGYLDKVAPGEKVSLDIPEYDYRAAFKGGIEPSLNHHDGSYHWSSEYKSHDHPTMWKEKFMQAYGADPDDIGIDESGYQFLKGMKSNQGILRRMFGGN